MVIFELKKLLYKKFTEFIFKKFQELVRIFRYLELGGFLKLL